MPIISLIMRKTSDFDELPKVGDLYEVANVKLVDSDKQQYKVVLIPLKRAKTTSSVSIGDLITILGKVRERKN